ncbi:MAG TPA: M20/M25/M40 family metallo-hydrolase [Acidobacteriota bacterium]|nr:M20/M25/M40 family metallo-hydrolase [Acidobacteriota bacterium]HQM64390.1 M20/M25/M40 family metallo-hydrolase [Acidobacteriota bacterium]
MDAVRLLEQLIQFDSVNPFVCHETDPDDPATWKLAGNELRIAAYLEDRLREAGFTVRRQPVHAGPDGTVHHNLLAEKGRGPASILFYGHMDTVTARPWLSREQALTPVRSIRRIDGTDREIMTGLGANDMKAGLAAALEALAPLEPDRWRIKLAFGVDEEFYSTGGYVLSRSDFLDDVRAVVVPETGDGPNTRHGPGAITLGRLGRCECAIDVPGTGGHGAQAHDPAHVSAAAETVKIAARLERLRAEYRERFTFCAEPMPDPDATGEISGSTFVSRVEAGDGSLSIPSAGRILVSFQLTPGVTVTSRLKLLDDLVAAMYASGELARIKVSGEFRPVRVSLRQRPTPFNEAFCTPADHPFTRFVRGVVDETVGFRAFNMGWSNADENLFAMARPEVPILNLSPLGRDCHKADEWVELASVRQLVRLLHVAAVRFGEYLKVSR